MQEKPGLSWWCPWSLTALIQEKNIEARYVLICMLGSRNSQKDIQAAASNQTPGSELDGEMVFRF